MKDIIISFGDMIISFRDMIISFGDMVISFGDTVISFGDMIISFAYRVLFGLLNSIKSGIDTLYFSYYSIKRLKVAIPILFIAG